LKAHFNTESFDCADSHGCEESFDKQDAEIGRDEGNFQIAYKSKMLMQNHIQMTSMEHSTFVSRMKSFSIYDEKEDSI